MLEVEIVSKQRAPSAAPVQVTTEEMVDSFKAFASEHDSQQKWLYDQMMNCVREMYAAPVAEGMNLRKTKKKLAANRVSVATLNNLILYMSAHHRLVSSLVADIADGKIGKTSRRVANSRKQIQSKKRKLESGGTFVGGSRQVPDGEEDGEDEEDEEEDESVDANSNYGGPETQQLLLSPTASEKAAKLLKTLEGK